MMLDDVITKDVINEILYETMLAYEELHRWFVKYSVNIQTKQTSEILSKLLENKCYEVIKRYYNGIVKKAETDKDVDLMIDDIPIEIKVTNGESWTGGEYSKRTSHYLLFSRNIDEQNISKSSFFVSLVYLYEDEWKSGGKNFYGTSYNKKQLINNENKRVLFGDIRYNYSKTNKVKGISIIYEQLNQ